MIIDCPHAMSAYDAHEDVAMTTHINHDHVAMTTHDVYEDVPMHEQDRPDNTWFTMNAEDNHSDSQLHTQMDSPNATSIVTAMGSAHSMTEDDAPFSFDNTEAIHRHAGSNEPAMSQDLILAPHHQDQLMQAFAPLTSMAGQDPVLGFAYPRSHPNLPLPMQSQYAWDSQQWALGVAPIGTAPQLMQTMIPLAPPTNNMHLNTLPAAKVSYGAYSSRFSSMAEVVQFETRVRWKPQFVETLPSTDEEMVPFVTQMYAAIIDFAGFQDKIQSRNKLNRLVAQRYSQEEIEAKCWRAVFHAIELHRVGAIVPVSVDPTMELKTPGRKEGHGEGESAYFEKKKAQEDRNLIFRERINEICQTVRVSKAAATDILDAIKLFSIIMAPKTARATKEDNRKNNAQKQESINRGKLVKTQATVVSTMTAVAPADPGLGFGGGSSMTTT